LVFASRPPYIGGMSIHLIKLSVGPESLADLINWQADHLKAAARGKRLAELMHVTRQMPKRAEELLQGGSIYWVIKGFICARQKLLELRPLTREGVPHCGLVLDHEIVRVQPRPRRPFQGWRYLEPEDAPPDLRKGKGDELPEELLRELAQFGIL